MKEPTLGNPQNTIEVLQKYNFSFQKKFGQNFLIDTHVLDKIIQSANITKDDMVLEIGPGIGTMTQYLAQAAVLIGQHRSPDTPVGIVRNAGRAEEKAWITTLKKLPEEPVDMFCVVLIGNSQTYVQNGKMITPRGYCIHPETQA